MGIKRDELIEVLSQYFKKKYKSYELKSACDYYELIPENLDPDRSKLIFIRSALNKLSEKEIVELAVKVSRDFEMIDLNRDLEIYLKDGMFALSFITRMRVIDYIECQDNMEGKLKLDSFLRPLYKVDEYRENGLMELTSRTFGQDIIFHLKEKKDKTYKDILLYELNLKYVSDEKFKCFLERLVDPEVRDGEEQKKYVLEINKILSHDAFELQIEEVVADLVRYKVSNKSVFDGNMKNLVFAPVGKMPDIVIDDSINNDIKIIGDFSDCLVYSFEPKKIGLTWQRLVEWWEPFSKEEDSQNNLYKRLFNSLDSETEKMFFYEYYFINRNQMEYPALIPQVYLHYDPRSKAQRNGKAIYTHQRMDFLMLLADGRRIVIEIDGKQHYADGDIASPELYAVMMKDTRDLQLKGYQVYRFGGYEFFQNENWKEEMVAFFNKLLI